METTEREVCAMENRMTVNGTEYGIVKLLGKGKGGYSYLAEKDGRQFVLKQIHHEPCDYYQFGNKLESEKRDYTRLRQIGIRMPELKEIDEGQERILKAFIDGPTIAELAKQNGILPEHRKQMYEMCGLLYPANTNIDYYPTNFVVQDGLLYYIDYECNNYMEQWDFENWGCQYWKNENELMTRRLILRPWAESDAQALYTYARDPRVGPSAGWPVHESVEQSREIIRTVLAAPENYAVCRKENGEVIGCIGLKIGEQTELTDREDEAEIGYWLGVPYWGQGMIPEAVRELQRHTFEDLNFSALWCGYYDGNEKSHRVQEKCGFRYHHTSYNVGVPLLNENRIEHVTRITREEWEAMKKL